MLSELNEYFQNDKLSEATIIYVNLLKMANFSEATIFYVNFNVYDTEFSSLTNLKNTKREAVKGTQNMLCRTQHIPPPVDATHPLITQPTVHYLRHKETPEGSLTNAKILLKMNAPNTEHLHQYNPNIRI